MRVLTFLILLIPGLSQAAASNLPISWITFPNAYIGPITEEASCTGGLVPRLTCQFRSYGANGLGTFSGTDNLGNRFTIVISEIEGDYALKTEAWVDHTTRDGSNNRKFFTYYSSLNGKRGKVEMLPDLPSSTPVWSSTSHALLLEWNSEDSRNETLSLRLQKLADESSREWTNREWSLRIEMETNSLEGSAKMSLAIDRGKESAAYRMQLARDSVKTLVKATRYEQTGGNLVEQVTPYECVRNGDAEVFGRYETREEATQEGSCTALAGVEFLDSVSLTEESLDVFASMTELGWFE